jgi:hypothetical protein
MRGGRKRKFRGHMYKFSNPAQLFFLFLSFFHYKLSPDMLHRHSSMMFFTDDDHTTDPAFLVSKSSSMYHPQLDQYSPPLTQKQIDRLSNQYNSTNAIQQLLTCSSVTLNLLAQSNGNSPPPFFLTQEVLILFLLVFFR